MAIALLACEPQGQQVRSACSGEPRCGADGRHSTVARQVDAEDTCLRCPRAMYSGYWNAPAFWRTIRRIHREYVANTEGHIRAIFQTDHDELLIGSLPSVRTR